MCNFSEWIDKKLICIIMRGLPGSGKSYKVRQLIAKFGGDEDHVFSADKYFEHVAEEKFIKEHGRKPDTKELNISYHAIWKASRLGAAHRFCFDQFQAAVDLGITPVIVDNTNTTRSQFERYFKYAEDNEYRVRIEEPESPWWKVAREDLGNTKIKYSEKLKQLKQDLLEHGQHGVPAAVIERLIDDTWQNIPGGTGKYVLYDEVFKKPVKAKRS